MKVRTGKIKTLESLLILLADHRDRGQKIVFTNGCFDLIHVGHVRYLQQARAQGDLLVIAVNADATVRRLKGPGRPVTPCVERMEVLAAFAFCDYVFEFTEPDPKRVISAIVPDVLVKGGDWPLDQIVGRDIVENHGGKVVRVSMVPGRSTSQIIQAIGPTD